MKPTLLLALAITLAGCSEDAGLIPTEPDLAKTGGFPVVILRGGANTQGNGAKGAVASTLAEAVSKVAPGGTVRVFEGSYLAENVEVAKTITFEAAGSGRPLLRTAAGPYGLHLVDGGNATLRGIDFENHSSTSGAASLRVDGANSSLTVRDASFSLGTEGYSAIYGNAAANSLSLDAISVTGGTYGVISRVADFELTNSEIFGQELTAVPIFSGRHLVADNRITDCGDRVCVYLLNGAHGTITNNYLSNPSAGPDGPTPEQPGSGVPAYANTHNLITLTGGAEATVVGNEIDGCGFGHCVLAVRGTSALIESNTFTSYQEQGTRYVIVAGDGAGGRSGDPSRGSVITARGNTFVGVGDPGVDRDDINSYAVRWSLMLAEGVGSELRAYDNVGANAGSGLSAARNGRVSGSGNSLSLLRAGLAIYFSGAMFANGNDVTDYVFSMDEFEGRPSDLTCNYWGDAGPMNPMTQQGASLYTPWAEEPVADSASAAGCGP